MEAVIEVTEREIVKQGITELCSNQQRIDTKMFLAGKFAISCGCNSVSTKTADSDVATLASHYVPMSVICKDRSRKK